MSTRDLHEYVPGQYQAVIRLYQEAAGVDIKAILDPERVRLAGYQIELWSTKTGGVQLIFGTDYTLEYKDDEVSAAEGFDVYGGYLVLNATYQAVPLYITARIVGGYTFRPYRPQAVTVTASGTLTMSVISDMAVIADTAAGSLTLTLPDLSGDALADNCQITIMPKGTNTVTVKAATLPADVVLKQQAGSFIWGGGWLPVGSAGGGGGGGVPVGSVDWWPGTGAPDFTKLICDGALYQITDYPALFGKLGTLYGGDGVATFGVPNLKGITPGAFGTQDVNGQTKGDGTAIGGIREDQDQDHYHTMKAALGAQTDGTPLSDRVREATTTNTGAENLNTALNSPYNSEFVYRVGIYSRSTELVGRWVIQAYDSVQEVPGDPAIIKDWLLVWGGTPALTVPNAWGEGVFLIGFQYTYNAATLRSNVVMGVLIDGFDRDILFDVDQAGGSSFIRGRYIAASNSFTLAVGGTDFTNPLIRGIYLFQDAAPEDVVLNPPADGWDTVFDNPTGQASVTNLWGSGTFEVTLAGVPSANDNVSLGMLITQERIASGTGLVNSAATDAGTYVRYNVSANTFSRIGTAGTIIKIRKFSGMLHVVHKYQNTGGQVYKNYTNVGNVVNNWGDGNYRLILRSFNNGTSGQSTIVVDNTSIITDTFVGSNTGGSGAGVTTAYYKVDNTFRCTYTTTAWYIAEIWKLS